MFRSFMLLLLTIPSLLFCKETLHLNFGPNPQQIPLGKKSLVVPAGSEEGLLKGGTGLPIPAETLVTPDAGTMIIRFVLHKRLDETQKLRNIMTLRCNSRNRAALYIGGDSTTLRFYVGDYDSKYYLESPIPIQYDKEHVAAITWGAGRVRFYLDGRMLEDTKLPLPLERLGTLHLGPYKDGYTSVAPGGDDILFKELIVHDIGLTSTEIAKAMRIQLKPAMQESPGMLSIPANSNPAPKLDGKIDEPFWKQAASLPMLLNLYHKQESFKAPAGRFMISADNANLYIGMQYIFPPGNTITAGQLRTPENKPEVWGSESFEFFLSHHGKVYRFAGNVAGGSTERQGKDREWTAPWQYKSSLSMKIDNSQVWEAEAAIPWSSLNLTGIPSDKMQFNFARSWTISDFSEATALNADGTYWINESSPSLIFKKDAPAMQLLSRNNPASSGKLSQKIAIFSPVTGKVTYEVAMMTADGSSIPVPVLSKKLSMKAGETQELDCEAVLAAGAYDLLRFSLLQNTKVVASELVPFKLDEIYLIVHPRFFSNKIDVQICREMLQRKYNISGELKLELSDETGKLIWEKTPAENMTSIPFDHKAAATGTYQLHISDKTGKRLYSQPLFFPGLGVWAKQKYDSSVIIPPFTPMVTKGKNFQMWGREYKYASSIFPVSIKSQNKELLADRPVIIANGEPSLPAECTILNSAQHHADFKAKENHPAFTAEAESFVEYDGLSYSKIHLVATQQLSQLKLRFTLKDDFAKYIHASNGSAWGAKTTAEIKQGRNCYGFYPMVWIGSEDKGICLFTEHKKNWTTDTPKEIWSITKDGKKAIVEVQLRKSLKKGEAFDFEFGYIASPVKPLSSAFPLNIVGDNHTAMMRRAGHAHVNYLSVFSHFGGSPNFFNDMPTEKTWTSKIENAEQMKWRSQAENKIAPYLASRCLADEYPEVAAYLDEWKMSPSIVLPYTLDGRKITLYECCPTTAMIDFYSYHIKRLVERTKADGIYYDFGTFGSCGNNLHGCNGRWPILAMRELYRRTAHILYETGAKEPFIILHNTDCVELPAITFATHLFNGEHVRQASSTLYHNGKDIQDSYDMPMFACELSSLPFGLTNSVYNPADALSPEYGGGKEPVELYRFRITQAFLAATLPHNTIVAQNRSHYGILEKIVRCYETFGVRDAEFIGYWKKPAAVSGAHDIYVSIFTKPGEKKALAIISHIGKPHDDQTFKVTFDAKALGFTPKKAVDLMAAKDNEYQELYELRKKNRISASRAPLDLGDYGSKLISTSSGTIELSLKHHCFAIISLEEK